MPIPFKIKDAATVRDDILRTIRNGLIARGVANPQLGPGSDYYVLATAIGNEFAVVGANTQVKADAQMPDSATGADLDRLALQYGFARRVPGPSVGFVTITTSANTYVPVGAQLVDAAGLRYNVTVGGTYTNAAPTNLVPVQAIDKGTSTNHVANDVLKWTSAPAYAAPTTLVTAAGLAGGVDAEGDEDLRARLLSKLQNPPNNCNWNQIATIAEASHNAVQKCFVYPAVNGPSTVHIAVTLPPQVLSPSITALNSTSKNRDIDALNGLATGSIMAGSVVPYIQGQLPEYVESVITSVTNVSNDVAIGLALPASPAAVPAGPGGGWIDGTPWPAITGTTQPANVTAVTSSTVFTVNAPTPPTANVTHIAFLDPTNWTLYRGKVLSFTGSAGAYVITLDTPFPNIAVGNYVWPDCVNAQSYVNAVLTAFGQLGPGEKTANTGNLTRGYRHPVPANSWPMAIDARMLRQVENTGPEVLATSFYFRTTTGNPAASTVSAPPNIFTPRQLAFYPI